MKNYTYDAQKAYERIQIKTDGAKEIIIRHGEAASVKTPIAVKVSGTLSAPRLFFEHRLRHKLVDVQKCLVTHTITSTTTSLTLHVNPTDSEAEVIQGKLIENGDFLAFKINSDASWTLKQLRDFLRDFLRVRRVFFADKAAHTELMQRLNTLELKAETTLRDKNDRRGNVENTFVREMKSETALSFVLEMPLFHGTEAKKFAVEIGFDMRDAGASYWFESVESPLLLNKTAESLMKAEVEAFQNAGCAVLEVL